MYQRMFILLTLVGLTTGCATARLPKGPDIYSLQQYPSEVKVAVSKVVDERGTFSAGTIGASGIRVKEEIVEFTTNHLLHSLNTYMNLNVVTTGATEGPQTAKAIESLKADGIVIAKIKRLKMHFLDAIMQPVEVDMDLDVLVYDAKGEQLLNKTVVGHYQKRIGLSIVDKSTGELVNSAVQDVMHNLVKDSEFKNAISQLA